MIKFSTTVSRKCRKYNITECELAFCELMLAGFSKEDAYQIVYNTSSMNNTQIKSASRLLSINDRIVRYMSEAKTLKMDMIEESMRVEEKEEVVEEIIDDDDISLDGASKENTLKELLRAKSRAKEGSDEWLKIQDRIINITQMKKDEVKEEDKFVHYYLPLTCNNCSLFINAKKKNKK